MPKPGSAERVMRGVSDAYLPVDPAKAGTHARCALDRSRRKGPGPAAGTESGAKASSTASGGGRERARSGSGGGREGGAAERHQARSCTARAAEIKPPSRVVTPPTSTILRPRDPRRDGRVAEGARLESVYTGNRIVGSNPTPSAMNDANRLIYYTNFVHLMPCPSTCPSIV